MSRSLLSEEKRALCKGLMGDGVFRKDLTEVLLDQRWGLHGAVEEWACCVGVMQADHLLSGQGCTSSGEWKRFC